MNPSSVREGSNCSSRQEYEKGGSRHPDISICAVYIIALFWLVWGKVTPGGGGGGGYVCEEGGGS